MLSVTIQFLSLKTTGVWPGMLSSSLTITGDPNVLPPLLEMFTTSALSQKTAQPASETAIVLTRRRLCFLSKATTGSEARSNGAPGPAVGRGETATVSPGRSPLYGHVLPPSNEAAQPGSTEPPLR